MKILAPEYDCIFPLTGLDVGQTRRRGEQIRVAPNLGEAVNGLDDAVAVKMNILGRP